MLKNCILLSSLMIFLLPLPCQAQNPEPFPLPRSKPTSKPTIPAPKPRTAQPNAPRQGPQSKPPANPQASPTQQFQLLLDQAAGQWKARHKVANLGLFRDFIEAGIKNGAPLYDRGDVAGCYRVYSSVVQVSLKHFGQNQLATASARNALVDMVNAFKRAEATKQVRLKAWRLRFAFDKVFIDYEQTATYMLRFNQLGAKYCKLGHYDDALIAYNSALIFQNEIIRRQPGLMSVGQRETGIVRSRALLALGQFKEASQSVQSTVNILQDWPTYSFSPYGAYAGANNYQAIFQKLTAEINKNPEADIDLVFLYAHELFFLNKTNEAFALFKKILQSNPKHLGALCFNELAPGSKRHNRIVAALGRFASQNPADRQAATTQLENEGRWALPFLRTVALDEKQPTELRQRANNLITALGG
jgi:tetratricopeptide (TPR) repeat protein